MKKRELEKAIAMFDNTPGCSYIDNYIDKLSREEIDELSRFLNWVFNDIYKVYDHDESEEYIETVNKQYICQMSEIHQCIFDFNLDNESGRSINKEPDTDISMRFRTYQKNIWTDQFKITGKGYKDGIDIDEYKDWNLLLKFIIEKRSKNARPSEIENGEAIIEKMDAVIQMVDLNDIGNK